MDYQFDLGQVVHHKRYDYRGVIYARDASCQADEAWYSKNQTQPDRGQPWYHVLVHESAQTTYVAETNLESDDSGEPIQHPLIGEFFSGRGGGRYHAENLN